MNRQQAMAMERQQRVFRIAFPAATFHERRLSKTEWILTAVYCLPNCLDEQPVSRSTLWTIGPRGKVTENIL